MNCGVLLMVHRALNNYGDEMVLAFSDGAIDVNIIIRVEMDITVNNEYIVLALPRDFKNRDAITIALQSQ